LGELEEWRLKCQNRQVSVSSVTIIDSDWKGRLEGMMQENGVLKMMIDDLRKKSAIGETMVIKENINIEENIKIKENVAKMRESVAMSDIESLKMNAVEQVGKKSGYMSPSDHQQYMLGMKMF